jgi:DNA-nicking Smr family endonuclease
MPPRHSPDTALWQRATRDVQPLAPRSPPPAQTKPATPQPRPPELPVGKPTFSPPIALDRFAGIDRASAERLKRGKQRIEARLDLHGMTQEEAHRSLLGFIHAARTGGKRCVLVITGRGTFGGGVLKGAVPRWFDEPEFRPHLLAVSPAQPRDGGAGALYVMLRRNSTVAER